MLPINLPCRMKAVRSAAVFSPQFSSPSMRSFFTCIAKRRLKQGEHFSNNKREKICHVTDRLKNAAAESKTLAAVGIGFLVKTLLQNEVDNFETVLSCCIIKKCIRVE